MQAVMKTKTKHQQHLSVKLQAVCGDNRLVDSHQKELFVLNLLMPQPAEASDDDEMDGW